MSPLDPFDAMLPTYVGWLESVTRPVADILLDQAALPEGSRVLEVCAVTGALSLSAAERGYRVAAVEMSPVTATFLTGRLAPYPGSAVETAKPTSLAYPEASFDAAFAMFKVMVLGPETPTALAEVRRVVRPGGRVAVAHWATPYSSPLHRILVEACLDLDDPDVPPITMPIPYVDPGELAGLLTGAGLVDVRVEPMALDMPFPAADDFLLELQPVFAPLPGFRSLTPALRGRLESAIAERVRRIETGREPRPRAEFQVAYARVPETGAGPA